MGRTFPMQPIPRFPVTMMDFSVTFICSIRAFACSVATFHFAGSIAGAGPPLISDEVKTGWTYSDRRAWMIHLEC